MSTIEGSGLALDHSIDRELRRERRELRELQAQNSNATDTEIAAKQERISELEQIKEETQAALSRLAPPSLSNIVVVDDESHEQSSSVGMMSEQHPDGATAEDFARLEARFNEVLQSNPTIGTGTLAQEQQEDNRRNCPRWKLLLTLFGVAMMCGAAVSLVLSLMGVFDDNDSPTPSPSLIGNPHGDPPNGAPTRAPPSPTRVPTRVEPPLPPVGGTPQPSSSGKRMKIATSAQAEQGEFLCGYSVAVATDGSTVSFGCPGYSERYYSAVVVIRLINGAWKILQSLDDNRTGRNHRFGSSVALNGMGTYLIASDVEERNGEVYLHNSNGEKFYQEWKITGGVDSKGLGAALAVSTSGRTFAMGAPYANNNRGFISVREKKSAGVAVKGQLSINGTEAGQYFGLSVDMSTDGNMMIVGGVGIAKVYEYSNVKVAWEQVGSLPGIPAGAAVRVTMSANGSRVALGLETDNDYKGSVLVFDRVGEDYVRVGSPLEGEEFGDEFGRGVSISHDGNTLLVGAPRAVGPNGPDSGRVYLFSYLGEDWKLLDSATGDEAHAQLGWDVAISGDASTAVAGAQYSNAGGTHSGLTTVWRIE